MVNIEEKIIQQNNINININTDFLSSNQIRNEEIFTFFNQLRNSPENYSEEAKKYDLNDIIEFSQKRKNSEVISTLIQNNFISLFLDTYVQKFPNSKEEIFKSLEESIQLKNYEKYLYCSEGPIENLHECIWNLLKENKEIAIDEILYKKIDYFIVSTIAIPDSKNIKAFFLLLKKIPD